MSLTKVGLTAAVVAAAGTLVIGGAALANAASGTSTPSAGTAATGPSGGGYGGGHGGRGPGAGGTHTPVTGDELAKVTAAVTAKDSAVTVTSARKDPDGSYDVFGTKAGAQAAFDVSADLKTVTADAGRGPGGAGHGPRGGGPGGGGPGGVSKDTQVTGDEAAKASAAVTAKDSAVTVTGVRKDPDGSYDVLGTKAGAPVMFDVSADLKTIAQAAGHGPGGAGPQGARPGNSSSQAPSSSSAA